MRNDGTTCENDSLNVDGKVALDVVERGLVKASYFKDAGVVYQDVETAELCHYRRHYAVDRAVIGAVQANAIARRPVERISSTTLFAASAAS